VKLGLAHFCPQLPTIQEIKYKNVKNKGNNVKGRTISAPVTQPPASSFSPAYWEMMMMMMMMMIIFY